jgi:hypothetical protein
MAWAKLGKDRSRDHATVTRPEELVRKSFLPRQRVVTHFVPRQALGGTAAGGTPDSFRGSSG